MSTFDDLVASRKQWIETVLEPWCQQASLRDLIKAEQEWNDFAGRVDAEPTLWTWAWGRFPNLVHDEMSGVNETCEVAVTLNDGSQVVGFPDSRQSQQGKLVLVCSSGSASGDLQESGPHAIDDIRSVDRIGV